MKEWYLPPIKGNKIGLVTDTFCLDSRIGAIGSALLTKNSLVIWEQLPTYEYDDCILGHDAEKIAKQDPENDWRIYINAPMWDAMWQRQGDDNWVLIQKGRGYA